MAGVSDVGQELCMALALWNGRDPILKERMFGLTGPEGNHGEDVKEYWWFLDALPSHAWLHWRYHYPQAEFPYGDLRAENARRDQRQPEYELLDTGVFDDDRYWVVDVVHAKDDPQDLLMEIRVTNAGPQADTLHVLPHLWFRNTWSWDEGRPVRRCVPSRTVPSSSITRGSVSWPGRSTRPRTAQRPRCCSATTRPTRRGPFGATDGPQYPKDGINDHVVSGASSVNPALVGSKCAAWYQLSVAPGETQIVRVRLRGPSSSEPFGTQFGKVLDKRLAEADDFYGEVIPADVGDDERLVARQAFAGMIWGKQFYCYDVQRWLDGDPTQPPPPPERRHGRNARWRHLDAREHPLHARSVGVPVVRRLGSCVPHGCAGARRPGLRQVPAPRVVPRVVPTSQRRVARVRMVVQ